MKIRAFILIMVLFQIGCTDYDKPVQSASPSVRVLLGTGQEIRLKSLKNGLLTVDGRREMLAGDIWVSVTNGMMEINGVESLATQVEIIPAEPFQYKNVFYRGSALVIYTNSELWLINEIDLEDYLAGVLPLEVSPVWNAETLKAQAVVSRTYAVFELAANRKLKRNFDLYADTRSQVYGGMSAETAATTGAVRQTSGEVIKYQGRIIQAFFHADSGGMTESVEEVFGEQRPYLSAVESPYSGENPSERWDAVISEEKFRQKTGLTNKIMRISVRERTISKRLKSIEILDVFSNSVLVKGTEIRSLIGPSVMKSTRANIRLSNDSICISGVGYGHGVGLAQWDAQAMGKKGSTYSQITGFFYPGTEISRVW